MYRHSKLSRYKVKKILECFADDLTLVEVSKRLKLNKKTVNRYYLIYRDLIKDHVQKILKVNSLNCEYCLGYLYTDSKNTILYKVFIINNNFYFYKLNDKPKCNNIFITDKKITDFFRFHYSRLSKFYGLTQESRNNQIMESSFRHRKSSREIVDILWKDYLNYKKL